MIERHTRVEKIPRRGAARSSAACRAAWPAWLALLVSCSPRAEPAMTQGGAEPRVSRGGPTSCRYEVTVVRPTAELDVAATCRGSAATAVAGDPHLVAFITDVRDARGRPLPSRGFRWELPAGDPVDIRYRVDLDGAARERQDADLALAVGGSLVAPFSSYALTPDPPRPGRALFNVRPGRGEGFVTELAEAGGAFSIALGDVPDATYGVFGSFERDVEDLTGVHGRSRVDVVSLDGSFRLSRLEREQWVKRDAEAVARFYGGFPAGRTGVVITPVTGRDDVVFGKVLSGGGATIMLFLGSEATRAALDSDWVLVHEMFHLGFPSFRGRDGMWLDEGLATYAEPLIRARAGMLTEQQGWAEVVRDMPLGVALCEGAGLEHAEGEIRAVYWGGAVVMLLADVRARTRSEGAPGLEDVLRAMVSEGWNSTRVMRLQDAIDVMDRHFGAPIVAPLARAYADHGSPVPLDAVLARLGVERTPGGVRLHDDAPLAAIRRAIMYGTAPSMPRTR